MAFRSSAKVSSSSGGTITATPTGVAAHDYLGAIYSADTISATLTKPTGWNTQATNNWGSGSPDGHTAFYADKDDASGTDGFGFSDSSGTGSCSLITAAWSGRDNAAPRSTAVVTTVNTSNTFSPISATINGITASASDDIGVFMSTDQAAGADRWTFSTITNYTEQQDGVATDWVSGIALDTRDNVSAGATGNFSTTITGVGGGSGAGYGGFVVAIKAASASAADESILNRPLDIEPAPEILEDPTPQGIPVTVRDSTFVLSPGGTLVFSGSATELRTRLQVPSGSIVFSGGANQLRTRIQLPSGQIVFSGSAALSFTPGGIVYTMSPEGFITFSGTAVELRTKILAPTGLITFSGSAPEIRTRLTAPTGQIVFSGASPMQFIPAGTVTDVPQRARTGHGL